LEGIVVWIDCLLVPFKLGDMSAVVDENENPLVAQEETESTLAEADSASDYVDSVVAVSDIAFAPTPSPSIDACFAPTPSPGPDSFIAPTPSPSIELDLNPEPMNPAIEEDHAFIREFVPPAAILTLTREYVTVTIIRTAYARVQLRIQYMPRYPAEAPLVEITSSSLPQPLLRTKEKACMDLAKESLGKPQVQAIYTHLHQFIQTNLFVPCWKEVKQVMTLCEGKGSLAADEKEGILTMKLTQGAYKQNIKLKIPHMYPEEGVEIEFAASNFHPDMQYMFKSQADEIVRRCIAGFSPDQAAAVAGQSQQPPNSGKFADKGPKLTAGNLKSLKHDVGVLKQMSDLRVATMQKDKKFQYSVHGNAERKEARKDLRRLAKAESAADEEMEKQLRAEEQQAMKELLRCKMSDTAQPSLLPVAKFLVEEYVTRLPQEICQACRQCALPKNPNDEALKNPQSEMKPMRTFCGHWLHYKCLNDWLTTPPFVRQCPVCDRRIWHPDWPSDHKQLEKAWQTKEARKREMADVSTESCFLVVITLTLLGFC
jgi:ubiquitin-protein ligase